LTISPSECPSPFTWIIQRRRISSGNARSIFGAGTVPYPLTSSPSARITWMRRLYSIFSASAEENWV
jgi:hypothetical protein